MSLSARWLRAGAVCVAFAFAASVLAADKSSDDRKFDEGKEKVHALIEAAQVAPRVEPQALERNEAAAEEPAPDTRRWPDACDGPCDDEEDDAG
jgi:hypothetical protein